LKDIHLKKIATERQKLKYMIEVNENTIVSVFEPKVLFASLEGKGGWFVEKKGVRGRNIRHWEEGL